MPALHSRRSRPTPLAARRKKSKPPLSRITRLAIVGAFVLLICATVSLPLIIFINRPLGPRLVAPQAASALVDASVQTECGGPPVMFVMVVGIDGDYASGFADGIRIMRLDFVSSTATLLAVPRDLWVRIPGLESEGIIENRVKSAYTYGNSFDVPGGGPSLLAQTLADNFGVQADNYIIVNFAAFEEGIDDIGDIDVTVPEALGEFGAGWQHMDGGQALVYARLREGESDLGRIERQTDVILAVRERMFSPQVLPEVPQLVLLLRESVWTDMSLSELSTLLCLGRKMDASDLRTVNIDAGMFERETLLGQEVLTPDYDAIRERVADFNAGQGGEIDQESN